jgi:prepilin-type N-terminal cleavage/methylation domain-containing protein
MVEIIALKTVVRRNKTASFTLVELLTVMAIISILAALVISTGWGVYQKSMRSRALNEIQGMTTALDGYKADNGNYPPSDGVLTTATPYTLSDGSVAGGEYQTNSQLLYQALSGQTNFLDTPVNKSYMTFKLIQLGNNSAPVGTSGAGSTYIADPWGKSYGYSTGTPPGGATTNNPYAGAGQFDLWSTGNVTAAQVAAPTTSYLTNAWIGNWLKQ